METDPDKDKDTDTDKRNSSLSIVAIPSISQRLSTSSVSVLMVHSWEELSIRHSRMSWQHTSQKHTYTDMYHMIQCPPKVWRQSYRNCSVLCCYNIYISVRTKQNNNVNYFYIMLNCTFMHSRHLKVMLKYISCLVFLKF